jgi:ATP-dependent RNA helicase DBP3
VSTTSEEVVEVTKVKKQKRTHEADAAAGPSTKSKDQVDASEVMSRRQQLGIQVEGDESQFAPVLSFAESGMPANVMKACEGFEKPTPIQAQSWPVALSGRDMIGIASTGSGKTLAFTLPGFVHVLNKNLNSKTSKKSVISILVLSPTRELATQIHEVASEAGKSCDMQSACLYGGMPKDVQRKQLSKSSMIVATPGRLLDMVNDGSCDLSRVQYLVLDEADRMLDMGFEKDVRQILSLVPTERQTLMFSATWPVAIQSLAHEFLKTPVRVIVGSTNLAASHTVTQVVEVVDPKDKESRLHSLLCNYHKSRKNRVLVFCLYKKEAARVETFLARKGWNVVAIHGDMSQADRNKAFQAFRDGQTPLLVATDVAARGLDIPDVEYVINLTFPLTIEDYVHRIGRTGRAGKSGIAHTLFTAQDKPHSGALINILNETGQTVPEDLMKFGTGVKRKEHKMYGNHFRAEGEVSKKAQKSHLMTRMIEPKVGK